MNTRAWLTRGVVAIAMVSARAASAAEDAVVNRPPTRAAVVDVLRRVGHHLEAVTPIPTTATTGPTTRGGERFGLVSYPMGVAYAGMLAAGDATGEPAFTRFVADRFAFLAEQVRALPADRAPDKRPKGPVGPLVLPRSLDDCGAMGAAMLKAHRAGVGPDLHGLTDAAVAFAEHGAHRLADGTIERDWPYHGSLWADDMYMAVPLLAQAGVAGNDAALLDDAARQVTLLGDRLFVPSAGLFTHGWSEGAGDGQPRYYWGRANGWCAMAMAELLDVLPADHPRRPAVLALFRQQARGIASVQGGDGLWHQMLDRPDSYTETSCSAMFTFALAKGVNRGWLDGGAYGPVALSGWTAVAGRVDGEGRISGTCVGTNYAADYIYYYRRPTGADDPHGFGPTLMAGAEIVRLLGNPAIRVVYDGLNPVKVVPRAGR